MDSDRIGRQTPTKSYTLPYKETKGADAIDSYNESNSTALEWQESEIYDILAVGDDGKYIHSKFGYSIPRRNGKGEVLVIRELYALEHGEKALHTAHRTSTSSDASRRLARVLDEKGYTEVLRMKKGETYDKAYTYAKQHGVELITVLGEGGGSVAFRTRTSAGGLGEGFDLLMIDEAQEYLDDQESTLKYTVTSSQNPQTILCGTPPTAVSRGTVFQKLRYTVLSGDAVNTGWAEWSVDEMQEVNNRDMWYECNPSLGLTFMERNVVDELGGDELDFNIQRLGYWSKTSLSSEISSNLWESCRLDRLPGLKGKLFVGIKFGKDGRNCSMSIAVKTTDDNILVETIGCVPIRNGNQWILRFLSSADYRTVVIDGAGGQKVLEEEMKKAKLKNSMLPTVSEVTESFSVFQDMLYNNKIRHMGQPSVIDTVTNCEKRAIGTNGGFGYKAQTDDRDISILDSICMAVWACSKEKERKIQKVSY